ncbi:hypothetical protein AB0D49_21030 [Streptomyces sp. NPDC048290]|uniref:hypothetical protein n=1 Tax=Streptomyces sp. NPDC048290 TaxID=3155811 RepID=UPI003445E1D2
MTREVLTVCLTPVERGSLRHAIAAAMAPFDRNSEDEDRASGEWDHWWLGSPRAQFWIRPGCEDDPRLIHDIEPSRAGQSSTAAPGRCCGGPLELLDIARQRSLADGESDQLWKTWESISAVFPPARSLTAFLAEDPDATIQHAGRAWQRYAAQPLIRALLDDHELYAAFGDWTEADGAPIDRDRFRRRTSDESLACDALLTLDGRWLAPPSPSERDYARHYCVAIEDLPADTVLVNVTYHC